MEGKLAILLLAFVALAVAAPGQESQSDVKPPNSQEITVCTKEFRPVCGSDGITYGNKCEFGIAKRAKEDLTFTEGPCEKSGYV